MIQKWVLVFSPDVFSQSDTDERRFEIQSIETVFDAVCDTHILKGPS